MMIKNEVLFLHRLLFSINKFLHTDYVRAKLTLKLKITLKSN